MARESTSQQFPSKSRPLLQRRAFGHQHSLSNHPKSHDSDTSHLTASPFPPPLNPNLIFLSSPAAHPHPAASEDVPGRDNAHSQSSLRFLPACLSRAETARVFGTVFLLGGLFRFQHPVLLSPRFCTRCPTQPNAKSRKGQGRSRSGGRAAGRDAGRVVPQRARHVHAHQVRTSFINIS